MELKKLLGTRNIILLQVLEKARASEATDQQVKHMASGMERRETKQVISREKHGLVVGKKRPFFTGCVLSSNREDMCEVYEIWPRCFWL